MGALAALAKLLAQSAERNPRLARAVEQGYDLSRPLLHGTGRSLPEGESLRPLFATEDPGLALRFTGGRRGLVGKGSMYPLVTKARIEVVPMAFDDVLDMADVDLVAKILGYKGTGGQFADRAAELNRHKLGSGLSAMDPFGVSVGRSDWGPYTKAPLYTMMDDPGMMQALRDSGVEALRFGHPVSDVPISAKGKVLHEKSGPLRAADAVYILDQSKVRSPWAQFLDEGIGLGKKKGGVV